MKFRKAVSPQATLLALLVVILPTLTTLICSQIYGATPLPISPSDRNAASHVVIIPENLLHPQPASPESRKLLQTFYESIEQWGRIVQSKVQPAPGRPNCCYVDRKGHRENDIRPNAYAAMVLGYLAECQPPKPVLKVTQRKILRQDAIALLRYLVTSHRAGGETCLDGKPWGDQWQSALWARAVAMAAWQLWPHLDEDLRLATVRMVEFEADRFITQPPKSRVIDDTGAEENAWNASMPALACNMMPSHPRADAWSEAAKKYMYNTFSVKADAQDTSLGDDERPINQWVKTVNSHDDFTVENHRLVHVGYLKNSACMLEENAVHWLLVGKPPPLACQHHVPEAFRVLLSCMNWNGSAIYFAGNDWRVYETPCSDVVLYSMLRFLAKSPEAPYLERVAVDRLRQRQLAEGGYYNARRDLEYSGLCASRLISCFYVNAVAPAPELSMTAEKFNQKISGVTYLKPGRSVLHRTPTKFASFSWAQQRMALAIPAGDSSVVWPNFASYVGFLNGEGSSIRQAKLQNLQVNTDESGFQVSGTLLRCKGQIAQDFFYASLRGDYTVYVERLRPKPRFQLNSRESGVIGLDYAINSNHRTLYGEFGQFETQGQGGQKNVHSFATDRLNIDNIIGYVVCRSDHQQNMVRFHDNTVVAGRKPHLQEWISLLGERSTSLEAGDNWACVVTLLNQEADQTEAQQAKIRFLPEDDWAVCHIGEETVRIDFARLSLESGK